MGKKLTKKEIKAREEKQKELRSLRNEYVEAIKGFWRDCDTTLNYYKLNKMNDKYSSYHNDLNEDERRICLRRYPILKDIKLASEYKKDDPNERLWSILRVIANNDRNLNWYDRDVEFNVPILTDDLYVDEILWSTRMCEILVEWAKKLGFTRIFFMRGNSSGAVEECIELMKLGMHVSGFVEESEKRYGDEDKRYICKQGLILEFNDEVE